MLQVTRAPGLCSGSALLAALTALNLLWGSLAWFGAVARPSRGGSAQVGCDSPSRWSCAAQGVGYEEFDVSVPCESGKG